MKPSLVILETHPVQYHAPVWRYAYETLGVPLQVIYGGDFSVRGYRDREFGASFQWESDLLAGYPSQTLQPEAADYDGVSAAGVESALEVIQPSAILSLGYHHPLDRAGLRWARKHGVPLIFRGETSDTPRHERKWWRSLLRDLMLRQLYRRCSACLYLGENSRSHYRRLGVPDDHLIRSPYCVDARVFQADELARQSLRAVTRQQAGIADDAWVLIFSGKLSWRKGVDFIPSAIRALPESLRQRVHLVFLGAGEKAESLKADCEENPAIRCHFTGFVNQSGLSAWYHAADVLLLPSLEMETWGLVVNDALHHGLPAVVTSAVGCAPDLVLPGVTGEVCQPGSAASLSDALTRCAEWSLPTSETLRQHCRDRVNQYTIAHAAEGLKLAWQKVQGSF